MKNVKSASSPMSEVFRHENPFSFSSVARSISLARPKWASKLEFLLSGLSYAVGLGNIWRFPYLCYNNGGGAFLIPYFTMLVLIGIPLYLFETALGQFAQEGPTSVWRICPLFRGIGWAMFSVSFLVATYYNILMAYSLNFLIYSFQGPLPWSHCNNSWNSPNCITIQSQNLTSNATDALALKSPPEEFFTRYILNQSDSIENVGPVRVETALCLLVCWAMIYMCLLNGIQSLGKVSYFTALFPYIVLTVFLVEGLSLPGAAAGIDFYLKPDWDTLLTFQVWLKAAQQIFFSLSPCWGGVIALASYSDFHNNCVRDTMVIGIGNCITSFYGGFAIFSIIGHMASVKGVPVADVIDTGAGLAFIAYPEAITKLPFPQMWSVLFFVMLLSLGFGTMFTIVESVVTSIVDVKPKVLASRKKIILLAVCLGYFLIGLVMCTRAGMYIVQLLDNFVAVLSSLVIGLTEVLVVSYVYGADRFIGNMRQMLSAYRVAYAYWKYMFKFVVPGTIAVVLCVTLSEDEPTSYGSYVFPSWTSSVGYGLNFISVSLIVLGAILQLSSENGTFTERFRSAIKARKLRRRKVPILMDFPNGTIPQRKKDPNLASGRSSAERAAAFQGPTRPNAESTTTAGAIEAGAKLARSTVTTDGTETTAGKIAAKAT
ncbi:sodium- and chloride-dependent glycine transporter 1 [Galendromus occidentalis]|uniref:Transporter n=1 Tax=Galendromus occidentalis TaxID=34638 RepID=A0AAJ7L5Z2_9ACAR|nr:sodium- and chloride-dependent glycine transporter 1 [Galendromus occidentalis]